MNPASPKFCRGVQYISTVACTVIGAALVVFLNFGGHEHVLSGVQRYMHPKVDQFFGITMEEILADKPGAKPISEAKKAEIYAAIEKQKTDGVW